MTVADGEKKLPAKPAPTQAAHLADMSRAIKGKVNTGKAAGAEPTFHVQFTGAGAGWKVKVHFVKHAHHCWHEDFEVALCVSHNLAFGRLSCKMERAKAVKAARAIKGNKRKIDCS